MTGMARHLFLAVMAMLLYLPAVSAWAHHVLGRPAYSLNEDSNTPPSMEVETQIGDYYVTFMAFPAFPRPGEPGRVNLYAVHMETGKPFDGTVTFKVRDDGWLFDGEEEVLGRQTIDDGVYRQGFLFSEEGDYIITAFFEAGGEPYIIDFPLRIGTPAPVGPVGVAVGIIVLVLVGVNLLQRRRLQRLQAVRHHADERGEASPHV